MDSFDVRPDTDYVLIFTTQFPPTLEQTRKHHIVATESILLPDGHINPAWHELYYQTILRQDVEELLSFPGYSALSFYRHMFKRLSHSNIEIVFSIQRSDELNTAFQKLTPNSVLIIIGHCCTKLRLFGQTFPALSSDIKEVKVGKEVFPNPPVIPLMIASNLSGNPKLKNTNPLEIIVYACSASEFYCNSLIETLFENHINAIAHCNVNPVMRTGGLSEKAVTTLMKEAVCGRGSARHFIRDGKATRQFKE